MTELKLFLFLFCLVFDFAFGLPLQGDENVSELVAQLKAVTSGLDELRTRFDDMKGKWDAHLTNEEGSHDVSARNDLLNRVNRATSNEVAFTVELQTKLENIPLRTTVIFDHLIHWSTEISTYDTRTGVFTCPLSGLYLFSVFIESASHKEAAVNIMLDGTSYSTAMSEPSQDGEDDTGGNVVLLYVNEGSRVWVETTFVDNQSLWPRMTTFSGVLIHPI